MSLSASLPAALRRDAGYSLPELLAVMIILSTVLAALASVFVSGTRSELEETQRVRAQQNARLALDRLRREVHCATKIVPTATTPVTSVTITLPAGCPVSGTPAADATYATVSVAGNRYRLERTVGATTTRIADYLTTGAVFTYFGPSPTTLGRLHVDLAVNLVPSQTSKTWRLTDDIVLRNTTRA